MPVCWQGFLPWPAVSFCVFEAAVLHCLPSSSDESEDEEETAFLFVFLELVFVPDSAVGDLPGRARETEALAALAEDRGRPSSSSDSSEQEEEEDEDGGAATRRFLVDVFTGVEVSGPRAGLLPRLEGGAEVLSTVRLLAAGWDLSGRPLSSSSSHALGRLLAVFLARWELVARSDSSSSS